MIINEEENLPNLLVDEQLERDLSLQVRNISWTSHFQSLSKDTSLGHANSAKEHIFMDENYFFLHMC